MEWQFPSGHPLCSIPGKSSVVAMVFPCRPYLGFVVKVFRVSVGAASIAVQACITLDSFKQCIYERVVVLDNPESCIVQWTWLHNHSACRK